MCAAKNRSGKQRKNKRLQKITIKASSVISPQPQKLCPICNRLRDESLFLNYVSCGLPYCKREPYLVDKKRTVSARGYVKYIKSKRWKSKKRQAFEHFGNRYSICGKDYDLQVHHLTYERLGNEPMDDLMILCQDCHAVEHEESGYADSLTREFFKIMGRC